MKVRHPREGDVLPLPMEFQHFDPDWVWVYGNSVLIAAPAHDLVMLLRLVRFGDMPPLWMNALFNHVIKETRERGFKRYITWLSSDLEEESQLQNVARRHGATHFESFHGYLVSGEI